MDLLWIIPLCIVGALVVINILKMIVTTSDVVKDKYLNYLEPKRMHYKEPIKGFALDDLSDVIDKEVERQVDIQVNGFIDEWKRNQA